MKTFSNYMLVMWFFEYISVIIQSNLNIITYKNYLTVVRILHPALKIQLCQPIILKSAQKRFALAPRSTTANRIT